MLSIAAATAGHGGYYLDLARPDYYLAAGEPPGRWCGRGARALGLSGEVERVAFERILEGRRPDGSAAVQLQSGKGHKAGYDLTFSVPKSVSAAWAVADAETRKRIEAIADRAIESALEYLEENAAFTRRGRGGVAREPVRLVAAKFQHGSARSLAPHLHVHVFVANVCLRPDGTTGALEGPPLFRAKMAAGALFRAELASLLERELQWTTLRDGTSFRVDGVPEGLVDRWSSRRHEIEEALARRGLSGAKAAALAALATRPDKVFLPRSDLYERWRGEAAEFDFSNTKVATLDQMTRERSGEELGVAIGAALSRLTLHQSHFSEREFLRFAAEEAQGRGVGARDVRAGVAAILNSSTEIVCLGELRGETRYTTREILELEAALLSLAKDAGRDTSHTLPMGVVSQVLAGRPTITGEQAAALLHVTRAPGAVKVVTGMAGTGKTFLLSAVREAFEREGYSVIGAALAGKAARGLELGAGISSSTLHGLLHRHDRREKVFGPRTLLVLDEAGMVGTRQMECLVRAVREAGGVLVLVGDAQQLQPIEHGGPFVALGRLLGEARLVQIQRQREEWAREAVKDIAAGLAGVAVREFAARGLLHVAPERDAALTALVSAWRAGGLDAPESSLIFAATNREASTLNQLAQAERAAAGALGPVVGAAGREVLHTGDRVLFTRNSRALGVVNGDLGTVLGAARPEMIVVRLDTGGTVTVPLTDFPHVRLGYAMTTHKGQGVTCDTAYVLLGEELQDLHLSYVQASRARGDTHLFTDRVSAGEELSDLVRGMQRDNRKLLAHDVAEGAVREPLGR